MNKLNAVITIPVDLTNPGQFFACCGLLELADRLWQRAAGTFRVVGWFERRRFCMHMDDRSRTLHELLVETHALTFNVDNDTDSGKDKNSSDNPYVEPIRLSWKSGRPAIHLDWWAEKSIKPWAGSMKERIILRAMLDAIDPNNESPFTDMKPVLRLSSEKSENGKPKRAAKATKREPFYFDPRRGNRSHPLDCGFSPDTHKMEADCCPALESLCFIGLQRARPASMGIANRSRYTVWSQPTAANLVAPVVCGIVSFPGSHNYVFDNYFRSDQRMQKAFSQAWLERSSNE